MEVIGQRNSMKEIEAMFNIFIKSEGAIKPHFMLTGPSGSGKTLAMSTLAKELDINFVCLNAAQLTKEGHSGSSLSKALIPLSSTTVETICFVDEFDKLFISTDELNSPVPETTIGVQNEFLKILDSEKVTLAGDYGKFKDIKIEHVLFVFGGAFNGAEIKELGDLSKYGIKNEFLGRITNTISMCKLSLEELTRILQNSPLIDKYLELSKEGLFSGCSKETCCTEVERELREQYKKSTVGARLVNSLIHKYFINRTI